MVYDQLSPLFKTHVDRLSEQIETLLWPERRVAMESFYGGIAKCEPAEITASVQALGIEPPSEEDEAEWLFRVILTACLERLEEPAVTNPDQAALYACSLDSEHAARADEWLAAHPEHRGAIDLRARRGD